MIVVYCMGCEAPLKEYRGRYNYYTRRNSNTATARRYDEGFLENYLTEYRSIRQPNYVL